MPTNGVVHECHLREDVDQVNVAGAPYHGDTLWLRASAHSRKLYGKFRVFVVGYGLPDFVISLPDFGLGVISFM